MHKVAIVIYSSLKGDGMSANFRAFNFAEELMQAGDDVVVVFDGSGTKALADVLAMEATQTFRRGWDKAADSLGGVCEACSKAYKVHDVLEAAGVPMLDGHRGHIALRQFLNEGRQIITF